MQTFRQITLILFAAIVAVSFDHAFAQGIYSSGRRESPIGRSNTGQRWGTPGGGRAQTYSAVPGRRSSSPNWSLRTPSGRHRRYGATLDYDRGYLPPSGDFVDHYDGPHRSPHSYSRHPDHNRYRASSRYTNPYDLERLRNNHPYSFGFSYGYGIGSPYGGVYPSIVAPPVVVPYGGVDHHRFHRDQASVIVVPQIPLLDQNPVSHSARTPDVGAPAMSFSESGEPLTEVLPVDQHPLNQEFKRGVANDSNVQSGTIQRIRSLRSQTEGDAAFRLKDYAAAEAAYRTATDNASERQAPWVRLAWAQVALHDFPEAVVSLKTALRTSGDSTRPWISGETLYGLNLQSDGAIHGDDLWDWLQEQPNSTDRLLLVSAFQHLRGHFGVGRELLELASTKGLDIALSSSLETLTSAPKQAQPEPLPAAQEPDRPQKGKKEVPVDNQPPQPADDFNDEIGVPLPVIDMPEITP